MLRGGDDDDVVNIIAGEKRTAAGTYGRMGPWYRYGRFNPQVLPGETPAGRAVARGRCASRFTTPFRVRFTVRARPGYDNAAGRCRRVAPGDRSTPRPCPPCFAEPRARPSSCVVLSRRLNAPPTPGSPVENAFVLFTRFWIQRFFRRPL